MLEQWLDQSLPIILWQIGPMKVQVEPYHAIPMAHASGDDFESARDCGTRGAIFLHPTTTQQCWKLLFHVAALRLLGTCCKLRLEGQESLLVKYRLIDLLDY